MRAHVFARENAAAMGGARVVPGARLAFMDGAPDALAYPKDRAAYGRLCRILTAGNLRAPKGECWLKLDDLLEHGEGLQVVVMPLLRPFAPCGKGGRGSQAPCDRDPSEERRSRVDAPLAALPRKGEARASRTAARSLRPAPVDRREFGLRRTCAEGWRSARALAARVGAPLIATNDALMHAPERRALADLLACIREKTTLEAAGRLTQANAERHLKAPREMARLFAEAP